MQEYDGNEGDAAQRLRRLMGQADGMLIRVSVAESEARLRLGLGLVAVAIAVVGLSIVVGLALWQYIGAIWVLAVASLVLAVTATVGVIAVVSARTTLLALYELKHEVRMRRTKGELALNDFS